jgi:hypothetical protein
VSAPNTTTWLPELREGRDGISQIIRLVNQLRRRVIGNSSGATAALFSTAIGRGDVLATTTAGTELVGLPFVLPVVYPSFTVNFSGVVEDTASNGIFRIRMGGTYGLADGTEIIRFTATSTGFTSRAATPVLVTGNTSTLVQMTLQSTVGNTARFKGGSLVFN